MEPGKPPNEINRHRRNEDVAGRTLSLSGNHWPEMGHSFSGIAIDAYDNIQKKYVTAWMATTGTGIFLMEGTASTDGKTIRLTRPHPELSGGQMSHRAI